MIVRIETLIKKKKKIMQLEVSPSSGLSLFIMHVLVPRHNQSMDIVRIATVK